MNTLPFQSTHEAPRHAGLSHLLETARHDSSTPADSKSAASYVRLEIQVEALKRLINQHGLTIAEIHCLDGRSKNVIRQALLDSLVTPEGQ